MSNQPSFNFDSPFAADDICARKHGLDENSVAANASTNKARDRARVVEFVKDRGELGATCFEVHRLLPMPYTTASARISELKRDGILVMNGERRKTANGCSAAVLVLKGES